MLSRLLQKRSNQFGWIPNPIDQRDRDVSMMGLTSSHVLGEGIWLPEECQPPVYDQEKQNSCVAEVLTFQLEVSHFQSFGEFSYPSQQALYTAARELHTPDYEPLRDTGCHPRLAAKALRVAGVADEEEWPRDHRKRNTRLPFRVAVQAHGRRGIEYAFIQQQGDDRLDRIHQLLRAGYSVGFGTADIPLSYVNPRGPLIVGIPSLDERPAGNHYQAITAVTPDGLYKVRNSWDDTWREDGHCYYTAGYMRSSKCYDFMVTYGGERVRNARPDISL